MSGENESHWKLTKCPEMPKPQFQIARGIFQILEASLGNTPKYM